MRGWHWAVLKVATNTDTTVENAYAVKSAWKCETVKENWRFRRDCLWDTILHFFSRSWHSCMLICQCPSSTHYSSYWWVNDILTQQKLSHSCHLEILSFLHVRLLPAILQSNIYVYIYISIYAKRTICPISSKMSYIQYQIAQLMLISMEYLALV